MLDGLPLTITELNKIGRQLLEESFPYLLVEGEISNLSTPTSGHLYFTLKDSHAQVRAILFRSKIPNFPISNGSSVVARATLTLYEPRGDYQLIIHHLEPAGQGAWFLHFHTLKNKLANLGLFSPERKKTIPLPQTLGLITSKTGAVLRDILQTLKFPVDVILYPTLTQGKTASTQIIQAIELANHQAHCDLLIIARGGGNLEDLAPFNDESLAFAIVHSKIPIISAVGHETDFTIADFVADHRALTPTAAATYLVQKQQTYLKQLQNWQFHFQTQVNKKLQQTKQQLIKLKLRLRTPIQSLTLKKQKLLHLKEQLSYRYQQILTSYQNQLEHLTLKLQFLNPDHKLQQGFCTLYEGKKLLKSIHQLKLQQNYRLQLKDGYAVCKIIATNPKIIK